jgi:hypothetical protein
MEPSARLPDHSSRHVRGEAMPVNCGTVPWQNYIVSDVTMPKFVDSSEENPIRFLGELDSYFMLKRVPESLRLQIAFRAISDTYVRQWVESVQTDFKNYGEFKEAFINLLWGQSVQAQVRNSIYLDKFNKQSGETLSSHFLKYSGKAAYLTPKLSEFDLVSAIAAHYPNHIGRALIASNANTIQSALSFLRRIEGMEVAENGQGRSEPSTGTQRGQQNRNRPETHRQPYDNTRREGTHVRNVTVGRNQYQNHNDGRYNNTSWGRGEANRNWREERGFVERGGSGDRERAERRLDANTHNYRPHNSAGTSNNTTNQSGNN